MAEQVSNTGCDSIKEYRTWADRDTLEHSRLISLSFLELKKDLLGKNLCQRFPYFIEDYLKQICIPEIFATCLCDLNIEHSIKEKVASLEAFQTYAVSLYDQIADSHLTRNKEPTILGRYGIKETTTLMNFCEETYKRLARGIEKQVPNAEILAKRQYTMTLSADKERNIPRILNPQEAILLQDRIAGKPSQMIALLCKGNTEFQRLARSLGNALSTIDDIIDLISLEDLESVKTTIPLAYLYAEKSDVLNLHPEQAREYFIKSNALKRTIDYVDSQLDCSEKVLNSVDSKNRSILKRYTKDMRVYLRELEND